MDAEEFDRKMAAADVCFQKGRDALSDSREWYRMGLEHIEAAAAMLPAGVGGL